MKRLYLLCLLSCLSYIAPAQINVNQQLLQAIRANDLPQVKALVAAGADVNARDENGATALMWAAYKGDLAVVEVLISNKANPNSNGVIYKGENGLYYGNALIAAAGEGHERVVKFLVENCNTIIDNYGFIFENEEEKSAWNPLEWAAFNNNIETLKYLISKGAQVDYLSLDQATPLLCAIANNSTEAAKLLINNGAHINVKGMFDFTPLHLACQFGNVELVKLLIEKGANVNAQAINNFTPLIMTIVGKELGFQGEHVKVCELLINYYNADINIKSFTGGTALEMAAAIDDEEIYKILSSQNEKSVEVEKNVIILNEKAKQAYREYNTDNALRYTREAFNLAKKQLGKDHFYYASGLHNLAMLYQRLGEYRKAIALFEEALTANEALFGKQHYNYTSTLCNLADTYFLIKDFNKAEQLYLQALKFIKSNIVVDFENYLHCLEGLSILYYQLNLHTKSEKLNEEYLVLIESNLENFPEHKANGLGALAEIQRMKKNYKEAIQSYEEAKEIFESIGKANSIDMSALLNNMAICYAKLFEYDNAEKFFEESLIIIEKILGNKHQQYAIVLLGLSTVHLMGGEYEKAQKELTQVIEIFENAFGRKNIIYYECLRDMAILGDLSHQYTVADLALELSTGILSDVIKKDFAFLSEPEKEEYFNNIKRISYAFTNYYVLKRLSDAPHLTSLSYNLELLTKGMILNTMSVNRFFMSNSSDSVLVSLLRKRLQIGMDLSEIKTNIEYSNSNIFDSLSIIADNIEKEMARRFENYEQYKKTFQIHWQDVQQSLAKNEAAIEFISFRYRSDTAWTGSTLYAALVLRPEDEYPQMIELFEEKQLQQLLEKSTPSDEAFVSELYATRGVGVVNASQIFKGDSLYQLIWQPLDALLEGVETIYFSPSGLLHQIAFAALPYQEGLLSERFNLHQLSSTRLLALDASEDAITTAVVYGGIDYDTEPAILESNAAQSSFLMASLLPELSRGENKGTSWQFLPGTTTEAEKVNNLLTENDIHTAHLQADQAQEETFKALGKAKSPGIIHVGSHGFFFAEVAKKQPEKMELLRGEDTYRLAEDLLLRSGLLFAGANHVWEGGSPLPGVEDGILTAYEVAQLNLSNTELVVLSACETGLGEVQGSEGVYGLQRAFKMAGAKNLIMSLWKVPDAQTVELMEKFYTHWLEEDQPIRDAFQQAQQEMQTKYDPYFWAAFVLVE